MQVHTYSFFWFDKQGCHGSHEEQKRMTFIIIHEICLGKATWLWVVPNCRCFDPKTTRRADISTWCNNNNISIHCTVPSRARVVKSFHGAMRYPSISTFVYTLDRVDNISQDFGWSCLFEACNEMRRAQRPTDRPTSQLICGAISKDRGASPGHSSAAPGHWPLTTVQSDWPPWV